MTTSAGDLLVIVDEKRRAKRILLARISEEDLRAAERTGLHVNREQGCIYLAILTTTVKDNGWKVREDLGSIPFDDFPAIAASTLRGIVLA